MWKVLFKGEDFAGTNIALMNEKGLNLDCKMLHEKKHSDSNFDVRKWNYDIEGERERKNLRMSCTYG